LKGHGSLGRVEGDPHRKMCTPNKGRLSIFVGVQK
jgi:hypothetical protein